MSRKEPAKGVKGFLMYDPINGGYIFRVYEIFPNKTKKIFKDYELSAEDIKITIDSDNLSLYEVDGINMLSWS